MARSKGVDRRRPRDLRSTPPSARTFWMPTTEEQLSLSAYDLNLSRFSRPIPKNELTALALNEVAASRGRGFFFYLPSRECWKRTADEKILPASRAPGLTGRRYPSLLFMDYVWNEAAYRDFVREPHRGRYLKCNALINPPPDLTPLFAVQFVDTMRGVAYTTPVPSLILYATDVAYYLAGTDELEQTVGRWSRRWRPSGADPEARLNTAPFLWNATTAEAQQQKTTMERFKQTTIEALYDELVRRCVAEVDGIPATFEASELIHVVPRPSRPEPGIALGRTVLGNIDETAAELPRKRQKTS